MKNFLLLTVVASLIPLAGCATGPDFTTYQKTVPAQKKGEARIWFYRPRVMFGTAMEPRVYLNGVSVGRAITSTYFYVDRPLGHYQVQCGKDRREKAYLTLTANSVQFVRLTGQPSPMLGIMSSEIQPEVVSEAEALKEIQDCVFIGEKQLQKNTGIPLQKAKDR